MNKEGYHGTEKSIRKFIGDVVYVIYTQSNPL